MTVRTRVAPSPTGDPHIGTAYIALVNLLFARAHGGQFLLRIEDTDRARSTAASERMILKALHWLGLQWDEGPDVGGPHGPYRQSERSALYSEHVERLIQEGKAFRCYCTTERLDALRAEQRAAGMKPKYDGFCQHLTPEERAEKDAEGIPSVVRMAIPEEGVCRMHDRLRGDIEVAWKEVDMQILVKSDGLPTYHLANVVDDHFMEITHVIRGEEWIPSLPKHLLLYEYFGWQAPEFVHLPLLRNPDRSKLSKRKNPTSILWYERMGYLPETLINLLGLFTVSVGEGDEKFTMEEIAERFDLSAISLGGPVFDLQKLDWLNGRWLRDLPAPEFQSKVAAWASGVGPADRLLGLAQTRIERLSDLGGLLAFFFQGRLDIDLAALEASKLEPESAKKALQFALWDIDAVDEWTKEAVERVLRATAEDVGVKFRDCVRLFYLAIAGSAQSVPLFDSMEMLGRDICRERLRHVLELYGGVSKKQGEAWRKERAAAPRPEAVTD